MVVGLFVCSLLGSEAVSLCAVQFCLVGAS